jgi:integrase
MPKAHITDITVRSLKAPAAGQTTYWDDSLPGFGVRVSQGGTKTFTLIVGKDRQRVSLGRYGVISLADARTKARALLARRSLGETERMPRITFAEALTRYSAQYLLNRRAGNQVERALRKDAMPLFGTKPLHAITAEDVADVLNCIRARGAESQRNRTRAYLSKFFNWCRSVDNLGSARLKVNPAVETTKTSERARDRVLSDIELAAIWHGADALGYPFCPFVCLLILSGQRRDEVAGMRWTELDEEKRLWTIPAERAKNDTIHEVPLPKEAWAILRTLPRFQLAHGDSPYVFTTTGSSAISGYSRAKIALDKATQAWLERRAASLGTALSVNPPWRFHDLRRTLSTGLARTGYPQHVVEKLLNHRSGVQSGIAAVYNRYQYFDERQAALAHWARQVMTLIDLFRLPATSPGSDGRVTRIDQPAIAG